MTVLMPSWYYEKKDLKRTPSILDGLDIERENRYRREGARFIINVGTKMGLRYDTMATGVVYFHRFYMFHSFKTFPRYVTACCCLFLAGKVEETPKKCKDIIRTAKTFLADNQFAQFGDDPKEEVMTLERILLQTIKFDLQVDHPYGHLLKYAKCLKGDKLKLQNMVQMAWTFINDSLCTTLCLQWEPEVIAIALMYLAGKLSKFEVVDWIGRSSRHSHWWDMFVEGMSIELLEDICHQVLDLYSTPMSSTPQDSPPATPPTKSTRKSSQPPSPIEASTSPAQPKPKDPPVGLPIPRLEPGELKRKAIHEPKKDIESKIPRTTVEGKSIPTITSSISPKLPKKTSSIKGHDTQPSSPTSPDTVETVSKLVKHVEVPQRNASSDGSFRSGIPSTSNTQPYPPSVSAMPAETIVVKPHHVTTVTPTTTFSLSLPPPTATYSQTAPPFYTAVASATASDNQVYPNMQQPPPQIFTQQPLQFQHPPPTVAPSGSLAGISCPPLQYGEPPHQYGEPPHQFPNLPPGTVPPFNSQFPPPPPIRPPPNINNPPPAPLPGISQHPPPVSGMILNPPPPPPGVTSRNAGAPPPPGITSRNAGGPPPPGVASRNAGGPPLPGVTSRNSGGPHPSGVASRNARGPSTTPPRGVQPRTTGAPPPPGISPRNAGAPPPPGISPRNSGAPPPPPGVGPRNSGQHIDNLYGPRPNSEMYHPRQDSRGTLLQHEHRLSNRDFPPRGSFDDSPRFHRRNLDFDSPYQNKPPFPEFDQGFHRPPRPNQFGSDFERSMSLRGFPRNLQLRNPGPRPRMMSNMPPQPGNPTGIPPVRITGSM